MKKKDNPMNPAPLTLFTLPVELPVGVIPPRPVSIKSDIGDCLPGEAVTGLPPYLKMPEDLQTLAVSLNQSTQLGGDIFASIALFMRCTLTTDPTQKDVGIYHNCWLRTE